MKSSFVRIFPTEKETVESDQGVINFSQHTWCLFIELCTTGNACQVA